MSFAIYYFEGGIRIASGDAAVKALTQRVESALVTGEATGMAVNAVKGSSPIVSGWNDTKCATVMYYGGEYRH